MMATMSHNYFVTDVPPARLGNAHQNIVPYQVFACADGHVIVAVGNDSQFARFCDAAGKREWRPTRATRRTPTASAIAMRSCR
jgi:formyl-CoA transferase